MDRSSQLLDEALGIVDDTSSMVSSSFPSSSVVLIEDCVETSGAFVIHHILKRSLSPPSSAAVVLVSLSHPFSHYDRILRKLVHTFALSLSFVLFSQGCNLAAHRDNRRFFFCDMLMVDFPRQGQGNVSKGGLIELYAKIQKVVEDISSSFGSGKCITIILDDFSLIEVAANGSLNHSLDFLRYCYALTSEFGLGLLVHTSCGGVYPLPSIQGCSLVILHHEDIYSAEESAALILQMEYLADVVIKAEPLATGLAADVHGQLTVLNKGIHDQLRSSKSKVHNFHFKLRENGVECFYPGTQA
ncbi:hypothetical protein Cgig2_027237 [Carnegiea gigantea]|uniref:Elongator complex protein 6 n=1 Tax=Carnegiea gigantea TaxID=171969 RepID=A0A9Q1QAH4_9CARY|nr:hypothetical protein Cgig2_027237 [Carnegiea gigantea]